MSAPLGNKNAAKQNRIVGDTLRRVAAQNPDKLRQACEALLDKAAQGDIAALKEIRDTLDGKPKEHVEHSGSVEHINVNNANDLATELERIARSRQQDTVGTIQ